jgi:hypothetical protein
MVSREGGYASGLGGKADQNVRLEKTSLIALCSLH